MLLAWPIVTIVLFQVLPSRRAILWSLLAAYMLLPVGASIELSGVPALDKTSIPNVSLLVCALLFARHAVVGIPKNWALRILIFLFVLSPFVTGMNNRDPLIFSALALPGMSNYDALSTCVRQLIEIIPFIIGYKVFSREADHRELLMALVLGALAYTLPILFEVRFSPQLHRLVYGYSPHSFLQQMRGGGFRPMVFMGHGLLVANYMAMALVAAIGLWRMKARLSGVSFAFVSSWLGVLLLLCKALGAFVTGIILGLVVYVMKPRHVILLCTCVATVIVAYPEVRGLGWAPTHVISSLAGKFSADREESFDFRLRNEDMLLAKANERPFFGWGTWGRNRVYENIWGGTKDVSVTDGAWISAIGTFGWLGYIAWFGILTFPFFRTFHYRKYAQFFMPTISLLAVYLLNIIDLIPNASLTPITWLIAGALSGAKFKTAARTDEMMPMEQDDDLRSPAATGAA